MNEVWPELSISADGVPEIGPGWVEHNMAAVQVVDVREPAEFAGPLGHISGAILIPLGELAQRVTDLVADRPIVAVCRSGARSAQATLMLLNAGFNKVANMKGGMLRWRAEGRPAE